MRTDADENSTNFMDFSINKSFHIKTNSFYYKYQIVKWTYFDNSLITIFLKVLKLVIHIWNMKREWDRDGKCVWDRER